MAAGAALTPWLPMLLWLFTYATVLAGILVMSAAWSHWLVKNDKGWAKLAALPMFVMCAVISASVALAISAASAVLAVLVLRP